MRARKFIEKWLKDKRGIEGLPMHLIIIIAVAVAVLAILFAIIGGIKPIGTLSVSCEKIEAGEHVKKESSGNVILVDAKEKGSEIIKYINFSVRVKVTDSKGKPVAGATVIISGAGTAGANTTVGDGTAVVRIKNAILERNQETAYMKIEVKASGYHKYIDEEGLILQRVYT